MSKPFMESAKKTEKRRPTDVLTGRYDDIMKVIHDVKDRMISRTWTNYREQVKADLQGVLWPIKWSYEHLEHLNQKYDKFNTEISQLKSIHKQLENDLDQGYFDRKSDVYDFLRDAKTAAEVISHSISKVETWIHEAYYAHSIYDTSYDPEKDFKKLQNLYSDLFLLKKEITHMTKSECLHRIVSCYNILAEMYDKIDYDYTEDHPVKTSRFGFAEKPKKTETRDALDRLMPEIHMNINELAKNSWTYSGAKKVVEKMIKAFEYIQNEFNKINHTGDKIVNKIVNKFATNKLFDLISDSYVPMLDDQVDDIFQEEKLSSGDRKELDDSQFGIPSLRKYPLTDEKHVLQAVRFFNKAPKEHKRELAKNIVKRAKELGMDWEKWESLKPYLDEKVQESWQDRKNGVNSHSKKQFFHVSFDDSFHNKTLYPRIPSYIANGKYDESEDNKYKENTTTKRICGSASIEGCLQAIMNNGDRIHLAGKELYVYVPEKPLSEYKIKTNKEIIEDKDVFDANLTGEMWILEPCKMKLYGTIVVDQISDKKEKPIVGDKDTKLNKYTFKWRWQVKPKAMDMEYADWEDDKNKITKVDDVPFDKVYFGTHERWNQNGLDLDRPLFVTPYKRLASIFSCVHDHKQMQISKHLDEQGIKPNDGKVYTYNLGYDEWNNMNQSNQNEYVDIVHVRVEGFPDLKEYTVNATGYVYEIDVSHLKDHIGRYDWMSKGKEFLIYDVDHVDGKENKLNIKCIIKGYPKNEKIHQEAAQHKPMYFYHMIDKSVKLDDKGLKTPDYVLTKEHDEDLYLKMTEKYRYRLTHGWNIYPDKKPEELTSDQIYDGINQFRKSKRGNNQIYMFRYPPYKELGPHMADLLKDKEIYAFDINDPNNQKYINAIDWGWDGSNTDNKKLHRQWYENISKEDYFKKYDDNGKPLFAPLNHISIDPSKGFLPLSCLQKSSEVIQETYHSYQEAVDINSLRQQCGEVFQQASQIHYGCLDENGERITASPFKDSWKMISTYHSQSIQSMEQSKLGVCFEHSFYIANLLKQRNLPYQTFFLNAYIEHEEDHSRDLSFWHQFTIVPNDTDSVVLIETSLTPDKNGVFLVQNMDDAVQHLIKSFNIQLSQEDTQLMKQDLIDVSTFQPRDGDTYIGYIDQVYQQGKSIKHEINIKKYVKLMKVLWEYMDEHDMLSPDGKNIYNQAKEMDDATAFDLMGLLRVPQLFQGEEQTFIGDMIDEDFHNLTPKQLESKLKGYVQESYMGMKHNTLKEKYHYIPLTPQSKQQYQDQGVFQFGLRRTRVNDNTKGTIFIDENHIVVAYVAVEKKINGERWITALEVSEEYQGHGYGVELLQVAVDDFGATYLSVNKNNTKALTMYQRYGWSICDETDHMFFMKLDEGNDE